MTTYTTTTFTQSYFSTDTAVNEFEVDASIIEDLLEEAGYSIGYWADSADVDTKRQTYTVVETEAHNSYETAVEHSIPFQKIAQALTDLATGMADVNVAIQQQLADVLSGKRDDVDSEAADCVVQVAVFGEIIYG